MSRIRPTLLNIDPDAKRVVRFIGGIPNRFLPQDAFETALRDLLLVAPKASDTYRDLSIKRWFTATHGTSRIFDGNRLVAMFSFCDVQATPDTLCGLVAAHMSVAREDAPAMERLMYPVRRWFSPTERYIVAWEQHLPGDDLSWYRSRGVCRVKEVDLLELIMMGPQALSEGGKENRRLRMDWKVWKRQVSSLNYLEEEAAPGLDESVDAVEAPIAKKRRASRHEAVPLASQG